METYYERHKEELKAKRRAYYQAHREEEIARRRAYSAAHREERREYDRKYRERKRAEKRGELPQEMKDHIDQMTPEARMRMLARLQEIAAEKGIDLAAKTDVKPSGGETTTNAS